MRPGPWTRSSTVRLAGLVFALQIVLAGTILLAVRHLVQDDLLRDTRALAFELRDDLLASYRSVGTTGLRAEIEARLAAPDRRDIVILLARADGSPIVGNLGAWPPTLPVRSRSLQTIDLFRVGVAQPERMSLVATPLQGGLRLLAGHVVERDLRFGLAVQQAMLSMLAVALPLALLGSLIAARMISRRLRLINETARAVGGGDLSRRVVLDASGDAFEMLGTSINAMLDRVEQLVSELRIVTDGLAHDLRSPLTRLKVTLERGLVARDDLAAAAILPALAEADALLAMLDTSLQISRAQAGIGREHFTAVDVREMLSDLAEIYGPVAEERGLAIDVRAEPGLILDVHRELLSRAVANLIDNATKHSGASRITLFASERGRALIVGIEDDGRGIAVADRKEALRRFGRLDPSRGVTGAGLGLSLVTAVARLHDGTLELDDTRELGNSRPGLRCYIRIPR